MAELARAIGFTVKPTGDVEVFKAALARARDEEEATLARLTDDEIERGRLR